MRTTVVTLSLAACVVAPIVGQEGVDGDRWAAFEYFVGAWSGEESATFGDGRGERTYELVLQDRYLLSRNRSVFPVQDGLPDGDVHDDWSVFSYDTDRETYVLRQFNSEGFVNTFYLDDPSTLQDRMVFVLEASENAPGTRATLAVDRIDDRTFEETFALTLPGAAEELIIRGRWTRMDR